MNKQEITVRLIPADDISSVLSIFSNFHPSLCKTKLLTLLAEMMQQGYQCAVAFYEGQCIGVIGIWIQTKFYVGKHIEYDNFYVMPDYRGKGVSKSLLTFVNDYAKEQECVAAELTCDIYTDDSGEFWESMEFTTIGHRYQKRLL